MSTALIWAFVGLAMAGQILMVGLAFAPMSFWRGIDQTSSKMAAFLWGYSHWLGPRLRVGELKPWYRDQAGGA